MRAGITLEAGERSSAGGELEAPAGEMSKGFQSFKQAEKKKKKKKNSKGMSEGAINCFLYKLTRTFFFSKSANL